MTLSIENERGLLQTQLDDLKTQLDKAQRRLEKLDKVQDIKQPGPGTVLRFSRPMAGGRQKYTFVAFRSSPLVKSWHLTGKANALRLLGLAEGANTWEDLLVAIGDSDVVFAVDWAKHPDDAYLYFKGTGSGKLFRVKRGADPRTVVEVYRPLTKEWRSSDLTTRHYVERNTGSYVRIDGSEVPRG